MMAAIDMTPKEKLYKEILDFLAEPPEGMLKYPSVGAEVIMEMVNPVIENLEDEIEDAYMEGRDDEANQIGLAR